MENMESVLQIIENKPDNLAIIISIMITFIYAFIMWVAYKLSHTNNEYQPKFAVTLVTLALITTVLMDLIQSNLALSLGMLGSLSIVRFRTNIKDPRDIGFVFWAMAIGLASATQSYVIGSIGSIVLAIIMIVSKSNQKNFQTMLLVIRGSQTDLDYINRIVEDHVNQFNVKAKNLLTDSFEIVYEVTISTDQENRVIENIFKEKGIDSVNLLAQNN